MAKVKAKKKKKKPATTPKMCDPGVCDDFGRISHFATCPQADRFRRR